LLFLPRALSAITDSKNAFSRLSKVFHAEVMEEVTFTVDPAQKLALKVEDATFEWEETPTEKERREKESEKKLRQGKDKAKEEKIKAKGKKEEQEDKAKEEDAVIPPSGEAAKPFQMKGVNMKVERGTLVAIVGPVGCGKVR
jgi:ATP-binding cassette subfamily C (CFTR/MRP) protein 1